MNALELEPVDPDTICPVHRTPFDDVSTMQLREAADAVLSELEPRERDIIERHLGLFDDADSTQVAIAKSLKVTPPRVRQIFEKGLRKLRHPERSKHLRAYVWDEEPACFRVSEDAPTQRIFVVSPLPPTKPAEIKDAKTESWFFRPRYWDEFAAYWVGTFDTPEEKAHATEQLAASKGWRHSYLSTVYSLWLSSGRAGGP